jgi:hypothetical protein
MAKPEISGIAPFFIVKNVPAALSFYRDRLGFDIAFNSPGFASNLMRPRVLIRGRRVTQP